MKKVTLCGINTSLLPKISSKECNELLERLKKGDKSAREKLVLGNVRLVLSVIKKFSSCPVESDDMFQAGIIGLMKAVDNFDMAFNVRFSTYAVPLIVGEIKRLIRTRNSLRVARSIRDTAYLVLQARLELEKTDQDSSISSIAKKINKTEREVAFALDAISDTVSIYEPVYNKQGDTILLLDQIADDKNNDEIWTEKVAIDTALSELNEREKKIVYLRYFEGRTQTEISNEIGLSQAQVSRLEKNALKIMKEKISI